MTSSRLHSPGLDQCSNAFLSTDGAGTIREWGVRAVLMFGWSAAEALGRPLEDVLVPVDRVVDRWPVHSVIDPEEVVGLSAELAVRHRDGRVMRLEVTTWQVGRHGSTYLNALIRDVTVRAAAEVALRNSEDLLQALVDGTREYGIFMLDPTGIIVTWNLGAERIKGYSEAEALGRHFSIFYTADAIASGHPQHELEVAGSQGQWEETGWRVRKDGSMFWAHVVLTALRDATGQLQGFSKVTRDLSDQRQAEQALRDSEERFRGAFDGAPTAESLIDLKGRHLQVNDALTELTGYTHDQLLSMNVLDLVHPDDRQGDSEGLVDLGGGALSGAKDQRYVHADGSTLWVSTHIVALRDAEGTVTSLLCHALDITQRRRYEEQLVELANHDPLTGLANRTRFHQELQGHLDRCQRYGVTGAVLMLDLDHFKRVNDSLGHNAGDELIISMAAVLRSRLRAADVVCRLGGDEFAILISEGGRADAEAVATAVLDAVRANVTSLNGSRPRAVTASIGIAVIGQVTASPGELLAEADLAMYDAKDAGRDRYCLYADDVHPVPRTKARMNWSERIESALENDGFELWAQPVVRLHSNETDSHELLLRMHDTEDTTIAPGRFLYIAERLGLITDIDHWVTTRAIQLLEQLQRNRPEQRLEINISGLSVGHAGLRDHIAARLAASSVDPSGLVFEITETAAVERITAARDFAEHLRELGCRFALDDFGAGFGSFYYLKHLPFDYVKIDGEFIAHSMTNLTDRLVIDSVVSICKGLGKQTIAEFVGDEATLQYLKARGIDYAQGYHLGRPLPLHQAFPQLPASFQQSSGR